MGNRLSYKILRCCQEPVDISKDVVLNYVEDPSTQPPKDFNENSSKAARKLYTQKQAVTKGREHQSDAATKDEDGTSEKKSHSSVSRSGTPRESLEHLRTLRTNATKYSHVTPEDEEAVVNLVKEDPKGAYMLFSPTDNGTWNCVWSKEYKEEAYAFFRPANSVSIPAFKFSGKPEKLSSKIQSSNEAMCLGWIEFIKSAKRSNGTLYLLPRFLRPEPEDLYTSLLFALHNHKTSLVEELLFNKEPLYKYEDYDAVGILTGVRGPMTLQNLTGQKLTSSVFAQHVNKCGVSHVFFE